MITVSIRSLAHRDEVKEIFFASMPNIREFRTKIAAAYRCRWNQISIPNIYSVDDSGSQIRIGTIAYDDPMEKNLDEHFASEGYAGVSLSNLFVAVIVRPFTGPSFRPTIFTPPFDKQALDALLLSKPTSIHYVSGALYEETLTTLGSGKTFKEQFLTLQIPDDEIPEQFLDPIFFTIMNKPIIASDGRTYDETTFPLLNGKSPFTQEALERVYIPNLLLRSEMTAYILEKESKSSAATARM